MLVLAQHPATAEDLKLQQWHEFSRSQYEAMVECAAALEQAWVDFESGLNRRAYREVAERSQPEHAQ